ncbi:FlgK family flagellar hook-associated protein [Aestuariispira insulae]|uniref:Flagellar hook-associated protein 1 n=1 Tax=Aestuariispira insulae TaxID=1461337 RepID=A0A3D9HSM2_9PROT|nr:flagellar basal body rod C-terminal domain-containing protein [Aestuariispira insulae]RED52450.1 flagellar hook-associated protein FlgK [Aestuariispira insulae]
MSLLSALSVAVTSVQTINTAVRTVSDNIANANNDEYNSRDTNFENLQYGGVRVSDITRKANFGVLQDLLNTISSTASNQELDDIYSRMEQLLGTNANSTPISDLIQNLNTALKAYEAAPESDAAEIQVITSGENLVRELTRLSDGIDIIERSILDEIDSTVTTLNEALAEVDRLNDIIVRDKAKNLSVSNLQNLRDAEIQKVAEIMQIKIFEQSDGRIVVYSTTGQDLTDASASTFTWSEGARTLTKSGSSTTDWIAAGRLSDGKLKALTDMARIDVTATANADGSLGPLQKLRNQLDEIAFMLVDDSVARVEGTAEVESQTDFETDTTITAGNTLTVQIGGGTTQTFTFGGGTTATALLAGLNGMTNVDARYTADGNLMILTDGEDITIGGTAAVLTELGLTAGTTAADSTPTLNNAYSKEKSEGTLDITSNTNLVGIAGIATGDSFTVSVGGAAATTITFGAGAGQVNTTAALLGALNDIEGVRGRLNDTGGLEISTTEGSLTIQNGTNTPLTALGFLFNGTNAVVQNDPQSGEQGLDFFEVEAGTNLTDVSRVNLRVNDVLTNGTSDLKKSAATGMVQALAASNRDLSSGGLSISNKSYTSLVSNVMVDVTKRAERYEALFQDQSAVMDNLNVRLRNEVGVDLDTEMAELTVLQNSYAASARVIDIVNQMFDSLEATVR